MVPMEYLKREMCKMKEISQQLYGEQQRSEHTDYGNNNLFLTTIVEYRQSSHSYPNDTVQRRFVVPSKCRNSPNG